MKKDVKLVFEDSKILEVFRGTTVRDVIRELDDENVIALRINGNAVDSDYEILEDNTLKVSCDLLKGYNKNDIVFICLPHEDNDFVLTYKIMSRVMYEDGNYYHCELNY